MVSLTTFLLWIPVFLSLIFLWWNKLKLKINGPRQINNRWRGLVEKYVFIWWPSRGRSWQDPPYSSHQPYWDSSPIRELVRYFQLTPTLFLTPGSSKTSFRHRKSSTFIHRRFANEKLYRTTPEKKKLITEEQYWYSTYSQSSCATWVCMHENGMPTQEAPFSL